MLQGFLLALLHFVPNAALSGGSGTCPVVSSQRRGGPGSRCPWGWGGLKPRGHGGPAPHSPKPQPRQGWALYPHLAGGCSGQTQPHASRAACLYRLAPIRSPPTTGTKCLEVPQHDGGSQGTGLLVWVVKPRALHRSFGGEEGFFWGGQAQGEESGVHLGPLPTPHGRLPPGLCHGCR